MNVLAGTSVSQFPANRRTYCQSDCDLRVLMGSADGVRDRVSFMNRSTTSEFRLFRLNLAQSTGESDGVL